MNALPCPVCGSTNLTEYKSVRNNLCYMCEDCFYYNMAVTWNGNSSHNDIDQWDARWINKVRELERTRAENIELRARLLALGETP